MSSSGASSSSSSLWDAVTRVYESTSTTSSASKIATAAAVAGASYFVCKKVFSGCDHDQPVHDYQVRSAPVNLLKTVTGNVRTTEHHGGELIAQVLKAHGRYCAVPIYFVNLSVLLSMGNV